MTIPYGSIFKVYIARSVGAKQIKNLVWVIWLIIFLAGMVNQILLVRTFSPLAGAAKPDERSS